MAPKRRLRLISTKISQKPIRSSPWGKPSLLAGLPQAPAYYDPYAHPERAKQRQEIVLALMVKAGKISQAEADAAWNEELVYTPLPKDEKMKAPHFTIYVRQQLEALFGGDTGAAMPCINKG